MTMTCRQLQLSIDSKPYVGQLLSAIRCRWRCSSCSKNGNLLLTILPRLEDHLKSDGKVDWQSIWNACKDCKSRLRDSRHAGLLAEDRLKVFLKAIDVWFSLYVQGWDRKSDALETALNAQPGLSRPGGTRTWPTQAPKVRSPAIRYPQGIRRGSLTPK